MTEPGAGSDLAGIATTARRDGDDYVVNGAKTFITNGINADLVVTAVKTDPRRAAPGACRLLVVERGMPGFARGRNLDKLGHARAGHRGAGLHRRAGAGREPARARGGPGFTAAGDQPAAGAAGHRASARSPRRSGRAGVDAGRTSRSARRSGSRSARSRTPASGWPRWPPRSTSRSASSTPACSRTERRRADRRGRGQGQVVVHRAAGPGGGRLPAAARRVRLHDRVPDRPGLRRTPGCTRIYGGTTEIMKEVIGRDLGL